MVLLAARVQPQRAQPVRVGVPRAGVGDASPLAEARTMAAAAAVRAEGWLKWRTPRRSGESWIDPKRAHGCSREMSGQRTPPTPSSGSSRRGSESLTESRD